MGCLSDLVWEMDAPGDGLLISHNMFDMLVFLMILCASTKKEMHFSMLAILCRTKTTQV